MAPLFFGIGIFGILGLSILWPLFAFSAYYLQGKILRRGQRQAAQVSSFPTTIDIFIPAHNEAAHIGITLTSIQRAIECLASHGSPPRSPTITIGVAADGCTDDTAAVARRFSLVSVTEFPKKNGKWIILNKLAGNSRADWIIFADAGALWPEELLINFMQQLEAHPTAMAMVPSYRPLKGGLLSRSLWQLETFLKSLESLCGGPVSLHGATVAYKTAPLKEALIFLEGASWLNDDVVIPLSLRALYPNGRILYPVGMIQDAGGRHDRLDLGRRKRMLIGNLQWVRLLLPRCFRLNPIAGIVAIRRLFRMFWAYWLGFFALGLAFAFHSIAWPVMVAGSISLALSGSFRQMVGAAWVSFLAPYRLIRWAPSMEISWK